MLEKNKEKNTILDGALSLTIATIIVKILGAIYKIPISHILGEEGMGYFNSAYTVYSLFYLLCTAGVPKAIMILSEECDGNEIGKPTIIRVASIFFLWIGIFICITFTLLAKPLANLIGAPKSYLAMIFISPSIFFAALSGVYRGYFSAKIEFIHVSVSQIIEGAGRLVFGLLLGVISSRHTVDISTISAFSIAGATIGSFCGLLYLLLQLKRKIPKQNARQNLNRNEQIILINRIIKISLPISLGAIIMSITNIIDLTIVMNRLRAIGYSEATATSLYGNYTTLATPIFNTVISLFTPLTIAYMPRLIKARDNVDNLNKIISDELNASYFIFVPLTFGVIVYSEEILKLLFADKGVYIGSRLLICLMLSLFFSIPLYIINCALEAVGKVNAPMVSMLIAAIFKTITGCVLIGNPKFGIFGASISTIVFYCTAFLVSYVAAYKSNAIMLPVLKSAVKPIINSFISIYTLYAVYLYTSTKINWIFSFVISVVLTIALYFTLHLLQRNTKCDRYSKLLNTQIN